MHKKPSKAKSKPGEGASDPKSGESSQSKASKENKPKVCNYCVSIVPTLMFLHYSRVKKQPKKRPKSVNIEMGQVLRRMILNLPVVMIAIPSLHPRVRIATSTTDRMARAGRKNIGELETHDTEADDDRELHQRALWALYYHCFQITSINYTQR